ncbi:hypothetical protein DV495_001203 [Geotrichum candidum]|nr:hypothetical protein DV495_001203 [Geotrichum candidum]
MASPHSYLPDTHCTPLPLLWGDSNSQIEHSFAIQQQQQQQQKFYSLPPLTVGHGSPPSSPDSLSSASCPLSTTHSSISSFSDLSTTPPLSRSSTIYSNKSSDISALWGSSTYGQAKPKFPSMNSQTTPGTPIHEGFNDGYYAPNLSSSSLPPNGMANNQAHCHSMPAVFAVQQQQQQQQQPMPTFNDYHFNEIKHHEFIDDSFNGWNNEQQQHFMNPFPPTPPLNGLNDMSIKDLHHGHHAHQHLYDDNSHMAVTQLNRRHSHKPTSNNTMGGSSGSIHRKSEAGLSRSASSRKPSKLVVNTELYKTELCATFIKSGGNCPYGSKCQFAHGAQDLKVVDRPPKWRSKPCQNWIKTGACAYNERCCFRHDTN